MKQLSPVKLVTLQIKSCFKTCMIINLRILKLDMYV